ncbi:transmembrane protein, putative (macronuclear) [Tetrahymena thermophila SB210]|uniref:Transmembrane protein, putative n=1 Tax=Tetrahymena thermophila (strain SB210) TaxID=312017 RepID=W7X9A9_TETTS|nr:transmembrane protein, putative [Tetrahymena thermophila SB210]EWS75985.1 transmembrane protein, putative [Tetrahymena thermophila SB210]|eukprot:XP_012651503.1 transmembrane protein, putative [Tetrahymena thermophila SB210]
MNSVQNESSELEEKLDENEHLTEKKTKLACNFSSECRYYVCLLLVQIIAISVSLTFGILFYITQKDGDKNDYCENESLKKWAHATSILFFISLGQIFILYTSALLQVKFNLDYFGTILVGFIFYISPALFSLIETGQFVCLIGLQINNSSDCGILYKVTLAYCIISYILIGLAGLITFIQYIKK